MTVFLDTFVLSFQYSLCSEVHRHGASLLVRQDIESRQASVDASSLATTLDDTAGHANENRC